MFVKRRKAPLLNPSQATLAFLLCAAVVLVNLVSSVALYGMMDKALEEAMFSSHIKARTLGDILMPAIVRVNAYSTVAVIALCSAIVAAYAYSMNKSLRSIRDDISRVAKLDLQDSPARKYGGAVEEMAAAFEKIRRSLGLTLEEIGSSAREIFDIAGKDAEEQNPADLKKELDRLGKALDRFD